MEYQISLDFEKEKHLFSFNSVARQADSAILMRIKDTVMLATVVYDEDVVVEEDFLPLTVQYIEKSYAAGKFPGGFVKRESKPGDFETLTSRIVDRSLRPLFPDGFKHPCIITILVLSCDGEVDLQMMALNAASAALFTSSLPIKRCVCGIRIGKIDGKYVINPSPQDLYNSSFDLFLAGVDDEILMIEFRSIQGIVQSPMLSDGMIGFGSYVDSIKAKVANEISEDELIEVLALGLDRIKEQSLAYKEAFLAYSKEPRELKLYPKNAPKEAYFYIKEHYLDEIYSAIFRMSKSERMSELKAIAKKINEDEGASAWSEDEILESLSLIKREIIREMALKEKKRADGRGLKDIRPIEIKTNILPQAHGSALFTRGQTQALVVCTIGGDIDAQSYELLHEKGIKKEKFMVHYNFPSFCVGEAEPIGAPGRRELGHGNLAKRALEPLLLDTSRTIRLVSEILESNGSSSMATVCGGSLALLAANIPLIKQAAGVAMGLIKEEDEYVILSDIMGLEDHEGDMDCKIAGTRDGITAMQMDIKLGGLDFKILKEVLYQAKEAREYILDIMDEAAKNIELNESILPTIQSLVVNPSKIVDIIGQAGKTIKEIIERFDVVIDLDKSSGEVRISGKNKEKVEAAASHIKGIVSKDGSSFNLANYEVGKILKGRVKKVVDFGAFIELPEGGDGLLHISKMGEGRIERVSNILSEGDEVEVKILSVSKGRIELSLIRVLK